MTDRPPEWLEAKLVESCALLEEATREHMGICSALGVDPDELEPGEVAKVAARILDALEGHERVAEPMLRLLQVQEIELMVLRQLVGDAQRAAQMACAMVREAMEIVGVDPDEQGAPSAFMARLHELTERNSAPLVIDHVDVRACQEGA